jgi:6-phosphogluconolactonase (cycloisomerase 2 family)
MDEGANVQMTADRRQTGADPCFVMMYQTGDNSRYMMTADYSGGSVSVFPVRDGQIGERVDQMCFEGSGPVSSRQEASHIHQLKVVPGKAEGYILATDLGADVIRLLKTGRTDSAGTLADWNTLDVTAEKEFTLKKARLTINLSAKNLLNCRYELVSGYPMPGRSLTGGIEFGF